VEVIDIPDPPFKEEPPPVIPRSYMVVITEDVVVRDPFTSEVVDGYLELRMGDAVHVVYEGFDGEEVGWNFGCLKSDPQLAGWFPVSACSKALEP